MPCPQAFGPLMILEVGTDNQNLHFCLERRASRDAKIRALGVALAQTTTETVPWVIVYSLAAGTSWRLT